MSGPALKRLRQIAKPDSFNDTLSAAQVAAIESAATDLADTAEGVFSQIKRIIHGDDAGDWNADPVTEFAADASLKALLNNQGAVPSGLNKRMPASVTAGDGDQACAIAIQSTPSFDSHVFVLVNGQERSVGDGVKTGIDCYFSGDSGATARPTQDIESGDTCHWVGSVAGFQLSATDELEFDYDRHTGSGPGAGLTIEESKVDFDDATGHNHTGAAGTGTKVPFTALAGLPADFSRGELLTYTDTANKVIGPLASVPVVNELSLWPIGGVVQEYGEDFTVRQVTGGGAPGYYICLSTSSAAPGGGTFLSGSNPMTGIDGLLSASDKTQVVYPTYPAP